jgi:rhamnogalacturonyl hydrolase YesR
MKQFRKAARLRRFQYREWQISLGRVLAGALIALGGLLAAASANRIPAAMGGLGEDHAREALAPQPAAATPTLPRKSEILAILRKVNAYQLEHPIVEMSGSGRPITDPLEHPWPRTVWYHGVMAAWQATREPAFLEQSLAYGRQLQWQVGKERMGPNRLWPIQLWAELYLAKKDPAMIRPSVEWLATPDPLSPAGSPRWYLDARNKNAPPIPLADSLYGMPAFALLAQATGDRKYIEIMNAFFDGTTAVLFDKMSGLYYRDPTYIGQRTARGKKVFWSRANGWVFAGIPRVLNDLPKHDASRQRYLDIFLRMAPEIVKRQGADGLWRVNLDDQEQFPNPETSGSGFFCFGLSWGINHKILSRGQYLPAVEKAWAGLNQSLSPEGKVLWGQPVDAEPNAVARESTHEFVTGAFMMAGSEVYKLAR